MSQIEEMSLKGNDGRGNATNGRSIFHLKPESKQ